MRPNSKMAFVSYVVVLPIIGYIYYGFAFAFVGEMQALVDGLPVSVPWYYSIPSFFVAFPVLSLAKHYFQFLRPLFERFTSGNESADDVFIMFVLRVQGLFWGFVIVFCTRLVWRLWHRKQRAAIGEHI